MEVLLQLVLAVSLLLRTSIGVRATKGTVDVSGALYGQVVVRVR